MPTGSQHVKYTTPQGNEEQVVTDCRCMIGEDHEVGATADEWSSGTGESLSVWEAADNWASNGKDPDYKFGYSEYELEAALND